MYYSREVLVMAIEETATALGDSTQIAGSSVDVAVEARY